MTFKFGNIDDVKYLNKTFDFYFYRKLCFKCACFYNRVDILNYLYDLKLIDRTSYLKSI